MDRLIDELLTEMREARGAAPRTVTGYGKDLQQCVQFVRERRLARTWAEVKPAHLRRFLADLHERDYARTSIARKLSALRALYRYGKARGKLSSDPTILLWDGRLSITSQCLCFEPYVWPCVLMLVTPSLLRRTLYKNTEQNGTPFFLYYFPSRIAF